MSERLAIVERYMDAMRTREPQAIDAIAPEIAENAELISRRGNLSGREAIIDRLKNPPQMGGAFGGGGGAGFMDQINWETPVEDGATIKIRGNLPPNPMIKALNFVFSFNSDEKIAKIETLPEM